MIPLPWKQCPKKLGEDALKSRPEWTADHVRACWKLFAAYQAKKGATRASSSEWELAWMGWVSRQRNEILNVRKNVKGWWSTASGIEAKGKEFGMEYDPTHCFAHFKDKVFERAGSGPWKR